PFAIARLRCDLLWRIAEFKRDARLEPVEAPAVETPEAVKECISVGAQQVQFRAVESIGTLISRDDAPETDSARRVFEYRGYRKYPFLLAVRDEAIASQLHRPVRVRAQPEVPARVFTNRGDFLETQAVPTRVSAEP